MKNSRITKIVSVIITILLAILIAGIFELMQNKTSESASAVIITPSIVSSGETKEPYELEKETLVAAQQEYIEGKTQNEDVRCVLVFNSGLIHETVVQSTDNEAYLRTNWETMAYDELGSIFMDYEDVYGESQNIILYGHYAYTSYTSDRTLMFTPLEQLTLQENYERNQYFALVTDSEVHYYQIAYVADVPLNDGYPYDGMNWMMPNYTQEYLSNYMSLLSGYSYYDTGVTIEATDKFITLQTCVENAPNNRLLVLAKQIA